jgi:hypothetical protein
MGRCAFGLLSSCALACAIVALAAPAAGAANDRRAIIACYNANPQDVFVRPVLKDPPVDSLLTYFDDSPTLTTGLWSSVQGTYTEQQSLLDVSQGTRQSTGLYAKVDLNGDDQTDDLRFDAATQTFANWAPFRSRARDVSLTIRPGLLAGSVPGGAGYVAVAGQPILPAVAAADERGHVATVSLGSAVTLAARARTLSRSKRLVVVAVPAGRAGLAQISQLARERGRGDLLLVAQLPSTPDRRSLLRPPTRLLRQPAFAVGTSGDGSPTSGTTRRPGLVSAIDLAPTALDWIGIDPPASMRGQTIDEGPVVSGARLDELRSRWTRVRDGRQAASFTSIALLAAVLFLLLGTVRGIPAATRVALRIAGLGVMWWPSAVLLAAVIEPSTRVDEVFFIAGVSIALAALTDRFVSWERAPIVPVAVCLLAYTVDLALDSELLVRSALGPSIPSGGRFYGVSNELEPILPIALLVGLAAAHAGRAITRATVILYGVAGLVLLVVVGWGRMGADVGGVITVGAGMAVATLVLAPGPTTRRRVVLAALVPVAALALLIVIDLVLSGGSHLTRNLLRANNASELLELVTRRYQLAWGALTAGSRPALFAAAALAAVFAWRNRQRVYGVLPHPAWGAVLLGGLAAGIVGALSNDSGPVLFINAVLALAGVTAYLAGRPRDESTAEPDRPLHSA